MRTKADLLDLTDGEVQSDEWFRLRVPKSRRWIYLPTMFNDYWDECVETVALAMQVDDGSSAYGWVRREEICRSGDVWFIARSADGEEIDISLLGEFMDPAEGSWQCVLASEAFVSGPDRRPVAPEEEVDGMEWSTTPLADMADEDEAWTRTISQVRAMSVITEHGVQLVGVDAASAMPGPGGWWLLPMSDKDAADLVSSGVDAWAVTLSVPGLTTFAVITPINDRYGGALAQAHGLREVAVLNHERIMFVDVAGWHCPADVARNFGDL